MLGLRFCARAFSSCGKRGPLFIAVRGPPTIAASLVAEHRLQTRRLSNCGSRAQLLRGMWDHPRPRLEPVYLALAGRLSTTAPPGKPSGQSLTWVVAGSNILRLCWWVQGRCEFYWPCEWLWGLARMASGVMCLCGQWQCILCPVLVEQGTNFFLCL